MSPTELSMGAWRGLDGGLPPRASRMLVCEKFTSSLTRLRGFHLGRVLPHEDNHHTNEREGLLAKSETSRPWRKLRRARGAVWEHPSY